MKRYTIIGLMLLLVFILPVDANAPPSNAVHVTLPVSTPRTIAAMLNITLLSAIINGCSQVATINATWTGTGYYPVTPSSFSLIVRSPNMVYGNTTDVIMPNNTVQWFLLKNIPMTLQVSFESCTSISQETLVYSDGTFFFVLR